MTEQKTLFELETSELICDAAVSEHQSKLSRCDTRWTGYIIGFNDNTSVTLFGRNYCRQRDCSHHDCMEYRIAAEQSKFRHLFSLFRRNQASHVTLTFGDNLPTIDELTLSLMRKKIRCLFRKINKYHSYRAVIIYELKRKPNGSYHPHCHIAFERSPHLNTIIREWNKINGKPTRVDVKYNTSKTALARYFAKRVALAGVGVPLEHYLAAIHHRQLTNTFGVDLAKLEQFQSKLVGTRNYCYKKTVLYTIFLGTMPKMKGDTVPPPLSEWGFS
jgi:hypothetical protein